MYEPRPYQATAIDMTVRFFLSGGRSGLVVMPTGTGKTVVFSKIPGALKANGLMKPNGKSLVLAHRDVLLGQAMSKFAKANPKLKLGMEQGKHRADPDCDVIFASVQTLGRANSKRIERFQDIGIETIITDESHRATEPMYQRVYERFPEALHVGFTATPFRSDRKSLSLVFEDIVYRMSMQEAIDDGWLARPSGWRIRSSEDITGVKTQKGDYALAELEAAVDTPARNQLIVRSYQEFCKGERTIVFCVGVSHVLNVQNAFSASGIPAAAVYGETPTKERKAIYQQFSEGSLRVLVNCGVLTEGYDEELIRNVIMARPTRSPLVYVQAIGRGSRIPDTKEDGTKYSEIFRARYKRFNVIDITDFGKDGDKQMSLPAVFGLPGEIDCKGRDVVEVANMVKEVEERGHDVEALKDVDDIEVLFSQSDCFEIPEIEPTIKKHSQFMWQRISGDSYYLPLPGKGKAELRTDILGRIVLSGSIEQKRFEQILEAKNMKKALREADKILVDISPRDEKGRKVITACQWFWLTKSSGKKPATKKQVQALRRWQVRVPRMLTVAQASLLLNRVIATSKASRKTIA